MKTSLTYETPTAGPSTTFRELSDLALESATGEGASYFASSSINLRGSLVDGSPIILTFSCQITPCTDPEIIRLIEQDRRDHGKGEA